MKKNIPILLSVSFCFLFTATRFSAWAQEKKKLTPEELKQWNSEPVEENILAKIPAIEKEKANDYARGIVAYTVKAILHRSDPVKYPIDEAEKSPQAMVLASLKKVSPATINKMKAQANLLLSDAVKRSAILGKFKAIDFTKKSIDKDIQKIIPIKSSNWQIINNNNDFANFQIVLKGLRCLDATDLLGTDDEMIIGGLKVGCSWNYTAGKSVVSCPK